MTTKRKRIRTSLSLSTSNITYIRERILPDNENLDGFTQGLAFCIEQVLNHLNNDIPEIPFRESEGRDDLETVMATFIPDTSNALNRIVDYWRDTDGQTSRSALVDHFLDTYRAAQEIIDKRDAGATQAEAV